MCEVTIEGTTYKSLEKYFFTRLMDTLHSFFYTHIFLLVYSEKELKNNVSIMGLSVGKIPLCLFFSVPR